MKNTFSLIDILNIIIRKWWFIAIFIVVFGSATYVYTDLFVVPMYKTDGSIYVNCETEATQVSDVASVGRLDSNYRLANSYVEILKSRSFLEEVARELNNKYSAGSIMGMLTVEPVNETELLKITVKGTDPQDIRDILESILNRAGDQLVTVVKAGSVEVVDEPYVPTTPYSPNKSSNTIIGMIVGGAIAIGIVFLIELFDTHVKSAEDMKNRYEEPVLGEIPSLNFE